MCRCGKGYCICSGTTYTEGFVDGLSIGYSLGYAHGYRAGYAQGYRARDIYEEAARRDAAALDKAVAQAKELDALDRRMKIESIERQQQEYERLCQNVRSRKY
jgi:hypothetical protein